MNPRRRIASLFRELADAFDDLERERQPKRAKKIEPRDGPDATPDVVQRVRRGLRRAGVRA